MRGNLLTALFVMILGSFVLGQTPTGDILGTHNLAIGGPSPITGGSSAACLYCHAPHSGIGGKTPLWSQTLSSQTYSLYNSTTIQNVASQPTLGGSTSLCLSCHDGTIAVGQLNPSGSLTTTGSMYGSDVFGANLKASHPISLVVPLKDSPALVASLAATQTTADQQHKVRLKDGSVECVSCHEPHNQYIDQRSPNFLVRDSASGQLCLSCHEPNVRSVNGKNNPLAPWTGSVHALSGNTLSADAHLGGYNTVGQTACMACHVPHNANGPGGLRPPPTLQIGMDPGSQSCFSCHSGASTLQPPLPSVFAEIAKGGHPYPTSSNNHDSAEAAVLVNNRHATCADCHNAHSSLASTFNPAPALRASQNGVVGISASDSTTVLTPAINQYENCFRCHGNSPGKLAQPLFGYLPVRAVSSSDPLDVIPQLAATATSSHPVTHAASSPWPQPSLLPNMLNQNGTASMSHSLTTGVSILCTDCHNSDDNREFGGIGPNGPHGSQNSHILERRYEFSQVTPGSNFPLNGPGSPIQNVFVDPNLTSGSTNPGPYAMCAKCHDLSNILSDASFKPNAATAKGGHFTHISEQGISCSVCHTAHGMGTLSANITGERLVNFDARVVAPNGASPISYSKVGNTCVLACHGYNHNSNGTVSRISIPTGSMQRTTTSR